MRSDSSHDDVTLLFMLSKSRFVAGLQCSKLLWLRVHEREAPELVHDAGLQAIFDQGHRVGELAQERFPGGVLIPYDDRRVEATREAIASGARILYEAAFIADDVFVAVDILLREGAGWRLIEVKSSTRVKDEHVADVAVQAHVLDRAGLPVHAVEIMHLNRSCQHPDLSKLFVRADVTARVSKVLPTIPRGIQKQLAVLGGPLPVVPMGPHCRAPYECPFQDRCAGPQPEHPVATLYRGDRLVPALLAEGVERIEDITRPLDGIMDRQRRAIRAGGLLVEGDLAAALIPFKGPMAFLDFETISLAVPAWPGCSPYDNAPVQFSVHIERSGNLEHHEWLAEGPGDPRRDLALALIDACTGAKTIAAYNAGFERGVIEDLAGACPDLASPLTALARRLVDLLPVVREHVYHPTFGGSFGLKSVLPGLTGQGYDDLALADGGTASASLDRFLFEALVVEERETLRRDLLAYCARDTWALVLLLERLRALAQVSSRTRSREQPRAGA
jgi:hypothetical protein